MSSPTQKTGSVGESIATHYLIRLGYQLLDTNWRYKNHHEIDLVMTSPGGHLVAVEVKSRDTSTDIAPFEAVQLGKVTRLKQALVYYALQNSLEHMPMRVDVVSVILDNQECEHFEAIDLNQL